MDKKVFAEEVRYLERTMKLLERRIREGLSVNEQTLEALDEQSRFLWEEIEAYYAEGEREFDRLGEVLTGLEELGYQPLYTLEQGVKMTIRWYKENGWL